MNQRDDSPTDAGYIAIACGDTHSIALRNDGTIKTWGNNEKNQRDDSPTDAGYISIACGYRHSVALRNNGTIKTWGADFHAQRLGSPTDRGYIAIACGSRHSVALRNDGTIKTWGNNQYNQRLMFNLNNDFMIPSYLINLIEEPVQERDDIIIEEPIQGSDDLIVKRFYNKIDKIIGPNVRINIDRDNVFESLKQHIENNGDDFFYEGTYIKFNNEIGIDQGGLTRDFFSLLTNEITKKYFVTFEGYSSIKNFDDKPIEDFNLIGKMFAYAIKTKHNINIKLNPIILDFLINSEKIDKIDITESIFAQLFKMFDSTNQEQSLKILEKISNENNITKRIRRDLDTLEKLKKFLNDYDKNILGSSPYSSFLSLNEGNWSTTAKICLDEPGFNCLLYEELVDIDFKYKDDYLLFIIRSFTFAQYLEEFYEFIKGFESIINLDNLKPFNLKLLNKLIIGNRTLDIDEFLDNLKINDGSPQLEKKALIKNVIREINKESINNGIDDYLNKFLYLITGSDSLPINGWESFTGEEFRLVFTNLVTKINSHTCDKFKYVEIPYSVIAGDDLKKIKENLLNILSYDSIVAIGDAEYCMLGGGIRNSNENNYFNKYIKYKNKYLSAKKKLTFSSNITGGGKCQKTSLKKYEKRPSPPYPANDCKNEKKKGNDGNLYQSKPDKNNVYKWIIVSNEKSDVKGSIDDFINLFQNIDFNLKYNPKTLKMTKDYMEYINDTNLKTIFELPKTFTFDKKVKQIISNEESYGNFNEIKFNVKDNKVNILDFLHNIYVYFKKETRDHLFLEIFTGYLDSQSDTIYITLGFGS